MASFGASVFCLVFFLLWCPINGTITCKDQAKWNVYDPEYDISTEKRLIQNLTEVYRRIGKMGRPVRNSSLTTTVQFGLGLKQMELNEKERILTLSMWTRYEWQDEYLIWNPEEYGGILQVTLDPDDIWIPDIMLLNTADIDVPARSTMTVVRHTGKVTWFPHCIYHSTCSVDVTNFPFDQQKCNLAFGSWTKPSKEVDIVMSFPGGIDLTTYEDDHRESNAWDIVNVTARKQILPSEEEYPNFATITLEIVFCRKVVFSTYLLTLPCVFLAFLTLAVFWLPPDRPDRTSLAMSTFSSFLVLLLILVEAAPPTARTIPILGVYYCINMVIIAMTVVLSTLVINLSKGPSDKRTRPNKYLKTLTLSYLSRVLIMPSVYREAEQYRRQQASTNPNGTRSEKQRTLPTPPSVTNSNYKTTNKSAITGSTATNITKYDLSRIEPNSMSSADTETLESIRSEIEKTRKAMESLQQSLSTDNNDNIGADVLWEWKTVSSVIDRFFFLLYVVLITLSLVFFFPRPRPNPEWEM